MKQAIQHRWDISLDEAKKLQILLSKKVEIEPLPDSIHTIAAVDVSYTSWDKQGYAVLGVFSVDQNNITTYSKIKGEMFLTRKNKVDFPYIPGFLSFREIPLLIPLFEKLDIIPDILLVDGMGIAHPRRLGLASHLGILYDIPSIGCGKSKLIGQYEEPDIKKGSRSPLIDNGREIGAVLRSKDNCRPLFISPGHKCDTESAVRIILRLCTKYRLAEPIRVVDEISKSIRRGENGPNNYKELSFEF